MPPTARASSSIATNNGAAANQLGIARFDNYSSGTINSATTGTVYKMTGNQTVATVPVVFNAVLINGTGLTLSGLGLYLSGGGLLTTGGSNTVSVTSLALGSTEGIVTTDGSSNTTTLSSRILGTGGLTIAGTGTLSLPTTNVTNGSVINVPLAMAGSSYTAAPSVTFSGGGGTTQATGYAVLSGTTVAAIVITSGGLGYTSAPTVVLGAVSGATAATVGTAIIGTGNYLGTTTVNTSVTLGANNVIPNNTVPVFTTGTWSTASTTLTVASTLNLYVGMPVTASAGLPAGAYIATIASATSITISANTTAAEATALALTFTTGQVSQASTTTSGSASITGLTSTASLYVGMPISGTGVPAGAFIHAINGPTSITISAAATAAGTSITVTNELNLTNGTITNNMAANTPLIIPNAVTFNPNISNIGFAGTGGSVLFDNLTVAAVTMAQAGGNTNVTIPSGFTVTVGTAQSVATNVILAPGAVTKLGAGTLVIATGNASTTVTTVEAGIVVAQATNALGVANAKANFIPGTTLQVQAITNAAVALPAVILTIGGTGASVTTGAIEMLGGGTGANTSATVNTLIGDTQIGVDVGQLTLSGITSGAAALTKVGLGMASLGGANTYNGLTNVNVGMLEATVGGGLGAITAGTVVASGATLDVAAATVTGEPLTLNGTGFGTLPGGGVSGLLTPRGAPNFTGAGTWTGNILLNTSSVAIGTSGGNSIVSGVISGTSVALNKVNANSLTLNGANTFTGSVTVSAGTLALGNANTYSGATTIGTTATLDLANFGTLPNTSGISAFAGSTLELDNSGTLLTSRLASTAGITLNGATLQFNANNNLGVNTTQTVGTITLASGQSTINSGFTAAPVTGATSVITSGGLSRSAGATVNFLGGTTNMSPLGTSSNQLIFSNLVTTSSGTVGSINSGLQYLGNQGNILPYAEVNGAAGTGDFATYGSNGVAPFNNYATQVFSTTGTFSASAGDIVKIDAIGTSGYTINAAANLSIGALLLVNATVPNSNITLSVSGTTSTPSSLTVSSGLIMNENLGTASNIFSGGVINLGGEGILLQDDLGTTAFNTTLSGSNGLTVAGPGTLTLAAANSITGATSLNQGVITLGSAASISSGALTITSTGTTTTLQGTQALTFPQAFTLNNANLTFGNTGTVPITFSGIGTLVGSNTLTITNTAGVYFNGQLTDAGSGNPGSLILAGAGTVLLNDGGTSNYLGGTLINMTGTVVAGDSTAFGSNTSSQTLGITAGTIVAGAALTLNQALVLNGSFTLSGTSSANNITFATNALMTAGVTLTDSNLGTVTFSGNIGEAAGARALSIAGLGQLALSGTNTYSGGTTVNTLTAGSASGNLLVNTGATLSSPTSSNPLYSSSLGSGTLTLTSGVLDATGGALTYNNVVVVTTAGQTVLAGTAMTFNGTIGLGAASTLLLNNATTFNGFVTVAAATTLTLSGVPIVSGTNTFSPTGSLTLTAPSNFLTNNFTLVNSGGTLTLSGNGSITDTSAADTNTLTVNLGGTVTLDNTSTNIYNRLPSNSTLALNGGTFSFIGTNVASTNSTQNIGAVTLGSGNSVISSTQNSGGSAILTSASLTRTVRAHGRLHRRQQRPRQQWGVQRGGRHRRLRLHLGSDRDLQRGARWRHDRHGQCHAIGGHHPGCFRRRWLHLCPGGRHLGRWRLGGNGDRGAGHRRHGGPGSEHHHYQRR